MNRKAIEVEISNMDPKQDYTKIVRYLGNCLFSFDYEKSLEFALFKTYAIPSISGLLDKTQEFAKRPRKRYDDTEILLACPLDYGLESSEAKIAIRRINDMHAMYDISNEDFLYVLSTFILEPPRWMEKYAVRAFTEIEKIALFEYFKVLGERMRIKNIPETYQELESLSLDYEKKYMIFDESNVRVGNSTVDLLLGMYIPKFLFPVGRFAVYALMDARMCEAFNYPKMPKWLTTVVTSVLRIRAKLAAFILPVKETKFSEVKRPTYPEGYKIQELGTFKCPYDKPS